MKPVPTADVLDRHGERAAVCLLQLRSFGPPAFAGPVATVRCHEDNVVVRRRLEEPGGGRVLVAAGPESSSTAASGTRRCSARSASASRRSGRIRGRAAKEGRGASDVPVTFGGVTFEPGALLYADEDGVVVVVPRPAEG